MTEDDETDVINLTEYRDPQDATKQQQAVRPDALRDDLCKRHKEANDMILVVARLIAPVIEGSDYAAGYR
jgi:hypothetical protein